MIQATTMEAARRTRRERKLRCGDQAWVSVLIGPSFGEAPGPAPTPQVFLVEQSPLSRVHPHFHDENQFQVVIGGHGSIGRHAVSAFSVHYAQGQTGYGPVVAGPCGLSYLSIRADSQWLTHYLPDARGQMRPGARENRFAPRFDAIGDALLAELSAPGRETLLRGGRGQAGDGGVESLCMQFPRSDPTGTAGGPPSGTAVAHHTGHHEEAVDAFMEKRPPVFKDS